MIDFRLLDCMLVFTSRTTKTIGYCLSDSTRRILLAGFCLSDSAFVSIPVCDLELCVASLDGTENRSSGLVNGVMVNCQIKSKKKKKNY
jgi:hypothetical protein